jgi:transcriptional regulator with XRE-family HTH domain
MTEVIGTTGEDEPREPTLAERLRTRRQQRGISQAQAARELDVARTAYRLWEMEAARPAPDRWRLLARWLGVSMTTLLLAEGLISEDEGRQADDMAERFAAATGEPSDVATEGETGDFFLRAQSLIDRSLERGLVTAAEAGRARDMFHRIERGLLQTPSGERR